MGIGRPLDENEQEIVQKVLRHVYYADKKQLQEKSLQTVERMKVRAMMTDADMAVEHRRVAVLSAQTRFLRLVRRWPQYKGLVGVEPLRRNRWNALTTEWFVLEYPY